MRTNPQAAGRVLIRSPVHAKMLRLELLKVEADLERELENFSLNCSKGRL